MLTANVFAQTLYNVKRAVGTAHSQARSEALSEAETRVGVAPDPAAIAA